MASRENLLDATLDTLTTGVTHVVGVAIFNPFELSSEPLNTISSHKVLVLKRAAHEDQFPNMWELSGGHIEAGETVKEAIAREVSEETGLVVDSIAGNLKDMRWTSRSSGRTSVQYNYVAIARPSLEIKVNPEEHSEWKWVGQDELPESQCSEAMRNVLYDAFKFWKEHLTASS